MSDRTVELHVIVVDEDGNERTPGADDKVTVEFLDGDKRGTIALPHNAAKRFHTKLEGDGRLAVHIQFKGFAELVQWFTFKAPDDKPKFSPFWFGTDSDHGQRPTAAP